MPFVKVVKNKSYFKTFQVKMERRRSGRTDYRQRHKLITQDKNKYQSPKYRLCVRFSNRYVLIQVIYAEMGGDKILCAASSKELPKYGLNVGLKNFSAAYCTGLLLARRLLKQIGLDEVYTGAEEVTGEVTKTEVDGRVFYVDEVDDEKRPFRCLLDVGIKNTTTGAKVFSAMKGASDGGLDIPHSEKRFPGYSRDTKTFDAEVHKSRIMGEHVADWMREMEEDDEDMYKRHFAKYIAEGLEADDLEEKLEQVHEAIRADPARVKAPKFTAIDKSYKHAVKKTYDERKAASDAKKAEIRARLGGDSDEEDEEDDE
jgi:large subunit ribosomal protein L5e